MRLLGISTVLFALFACTEAADPAAIDLESQEALGTPDLRIAAAEVEELPGQVLRYTFDIENAGDGESTGFYAHVMVNGERGREGSSDYDSWAFVRALAPGGRTPVSVEIGVEPGVHSSWLYVDTDDQIAELDEENNAFGPLSVEVIAPGPDLSVEVLSAIFDGTNTVYKIEVTNHGDEDTGGFYIDLFEQATGVPPVCDFGDAWTYVEGVIAGDSFVWNAVGYGTPNPSFETVVYADSCDSVPENDEADNLVWVTVSQ